MVLGESLYKFNNTQRKDTVNENESLFIYSFNLLRDSDNNINEMLKKIHIGAILSESKNEYYLKEFSIGDTIKTIIDWFIKMIQQIWGKFKSMFQKIVYNDETIKKYEDKLRNLKGSFNIDFERYNYTCFDADIPSINLKTQFNTDYNDLIGKLESIRDLKSKQERIYRMQVVESEVSTKSKDPAYYDKVRQITLGLPYMVSSDNYAEELFNRFRDGGSFRSSKIDRIEVSIILDRYFKSKEIKKQLEESKKETIKSADDVKSKIGRLSLQKLNSSYVPYDMEEEVLFNKIINTKTGEVSNVCNIFVMAFSAKLDAVKEAIAQDKRILFEAIKYINIGGDM